MAKKKATMTLKDFHGGSILSDLPLPSAPGASVRPADRGDFDRQTSWGNPMGRSEQRLRSASSGSNRNFDDKIPFMRHTAHIGSHFEEDERKSLDMVSGSFRVAGDESTRALPSHVVESKKDYLSGNRVGSQLAGLTVSSYAGRLSEVNNAGLKNQISGSGNEIVGVNYQNVGGTAGQTVAGSHPNAWRVRKETAGVREPVSASWSAPDAASKLAHASALEKVSSGRWHSKQLVHAQNDVQLIGHVDNERELNYRGNNLYDKDYHRIDVVGGAECQDIALAMHVERSLVVDNEVRVGGKRISPFVRARSTAYMDTDARNPSVNANEFQPLRTSIKSGGHELPSPAPLESSERPKLNLLPRSKPFENLDLLVEYKQLNNPVKVEDVIELYGSAHPIQPGLAESAVGNQTSVRPKLNLKPLSQPLGLSEGNIEIKRNIVFGGARPREVVLKERRSDDAAANNFGCESSFRVKQDSPKTETLSVLAVTNYNDNAENGHGDKRTMKHIDRRDHMMDLERTDLQQRNKRHENWRNNREIEKHHNQLHQQSQGRPPSPETWRKPVENEKPASSSAPGQRYGKAASAVELAQAFSRSVSDPTVVDRFSGPRGLPSQGQMPFSRLTGPTPRPQINGY